MGGQCQSPVMATESAEWGMLQLRSQERWEQRWGSQSCLCSLLAGRPDRVPVPAVHPELRARLPPPHRPVQERRPQRDPAHLPVPRGRQAPHQHEVQPAALPPAPLGHRRVGRGRDSPPHRGIAGEASQPFQSCSAEGFYRPAEPCVATTAVQGTAGPRGSVLCPLFASFVIVAQGQS